MLNNSNKVIIFKNSYKVIIFNNSYKVIILTAKVLSPAGSARSFSKSVAQLPTLPMSMPRSLATLPVWEETSGSTSSVMVTSSP